MVLNDALELLFLLLDQHFHLALLILSDDLLFLRVDVDIFFEGLEDHGLLELHVLVLFFLLALYASLDLFIVDLAGLLPVEVLYQLGVLAQAVMGEPGHRETR